MNRLEDFLTLTQEELFKALRRLYKSKAVVNWGKYLLVRGEAPIMLIAHLDTVHKEPVKAICTTENGNILMSPQGIGGDDRCGVFALVDARRQAVHKPWLLFTCDEEIGGKGTSEFCNQYRNGKLPEELSELKLLIEIDRKGANDAVYYYCENDEFEKYITSKGFKTAYGSFSDISYIAPYLGIAAVNISSGYYNAHTLHEYINREQLNETVGKVLEIIEDCVNPDFPQYKYIEDSHLPFSVRHMSIDEPELDNVPEELREIYLELLDYYSLENLEGIRNCYGDEAIFELYEIEFGWYNNY